MKMRQINEILFGLKGIFYFISNIRECDTMKYQYSKFFIISILGFVFLSLNTLFAQEKLFNKIQPHLTIKEQLNNSFSDEKIHSFKRDMMNERQGKRFEPRLPFRDDIQHWNGKQRRHFEVDRNPFTNPSPIKAQMNDYVWVNVDKYTYTYDANGNMTEELRQWWKRNHWVISYRFTYNYDANGNMMEELYQNWENNTWVFRWKYTYTYTYDANGNITEMLEQDWYNNAWLNNYKSTYTYDANGNMTEYLHQYWSGYNIWVNSSKYIYTYDTNGNMTEELWQWWDWDYNTWWNREKVTYTYNDNGNLKESLYQEYWGNNLLNNAKVTYTYNINGNIIEVLSQWWEDNTWVNGRKVTYTYDVNGNIMEMLEQYWSRYYKVWVNGRKETYTYDANGNLTEELRQRWDVPLSIADDNPLPKQYSLSQNRPNPFNPVTTIHYDLPEQSQVTLMIYDIRGREIRELVNNTQDAGYKSVIWDGTDEFGRSVGTGIYLYQIQAGDFTQTRKMLLLK